MKLAFIVWALLGLSACFTVMIPPLSPMQAERAMKTWPEMNLEKLEEARHLYIDKCSSCHNLHLASEFTMEQWKPILDKMALKAKLTEDEKEQVWRYLAAAQIDDDKKN